MEDLKSYRLNSLEEPSDEQLSAIMQQVGEMARENSRKAKAELARRMEDVRQYALSLNNIKR